MERGKHVDKEKVGSVAANPDNLEDSTEAGGCARGTKGLSKNCTSRESVSPLSRLIINRGFRNVLLLLLSSHQKPFRSLLSTF